MKTIGVWAVINPKGYVHTSTISTRKETAMRRLLNPIEQKYHGLVNRNFQKWADKGYEIRKFNLTLRKQKA